MSKFLRTTLAIIAVLVALQGGDTLARGRSGGHAGASHHAKGR